jgi:hypothetical protein
MAMAGWFGRRILTRREKRRFDVELVTSAITPLLESITKLTEQNQTMVERLLFEQSKNLDLMKERGELLDKVDRLEKEVKSLTKKVTELIKLT